MRVCWTVDNLADAADLGMGVIDEPRPPGTDPALEVGMPAILGLLDRHDVPPQQMLGEDRLEAFEGGWTDAVGCLRQADAGILDFAHRADAGRLLDEEAAVGEGMKVTSGQPAAELPVRFLRGGLFHLPQFAGQGTLCPVDLQHRLQG